MGESLAALANRYALSLDWIATVVLGVKNRTELPARVEAEAKGRLLPDLADLFDCMVSRG